MLSIWSILCRLRWLENNLTSNRRQELKENQKVLVDQLMGIVTGGSPGPPTRQLIGKIKHWWGILRMLWFRIISHIQIIGNCILQRKLKFPALLNYWGIPTSFPSLTNIIISSQMHGHHLQHRGQQHPLWHHQQMQRPAQEQGWLSLLPALQTGCYSSGGHHVPGIDSHHWRMTPIVILWWYRNWGEWWADLMKKQCQSSPRVWRMQKARAERRF